MFRQLTAIFLFAAFVAQTFNGGFVTINYFTNPAAFAKNCINKAKPKMQCNGKCQIMKKLQEEEKKEQQLPERKFENKIEVFSSESFYYGLTIPVISAKKTIPQEANNNPQDISQDFFHPPQV